jgi:hypothetical protein
MRTRFRCSIGLALFATALSPAFADDFRGTFRGCGGSQPVVRIELTNRGYTAAMPQPDGTWATYPTPAIYPQTGAKFLAEQGEDPDALDPIDVPQSVLTVDDAVLLRMSPAWERAHRHPADRFIPDLIMVGDDTDGNRHLLLLCKSADQ